MYNESLLLFFIKEHLVAKYVRMFGYISSNIVFTYSLRTVNVVGDSAP